MESRRSAQTNLLEGVADPFSYRSKDFVTRRSHLSGTSNSSPRTTIAVVTADIRSDFSSRCISLVKEHTSNFDLIVLDNSRDRGFSHPREMNKVMRTIDTDLLVLLDDDVFVEQGWLEGLIRCLDERTAVVVPMHKDKYGKISFTGNYLAGDGLGTHEHTFDVPSSPRPAQSCCSAAILIDMRKCGQIFMEEAYRKYFFDIVHSLEIWEAGYRVVVTPEVIVTHIGGATAIRGSESSDQLLQLDRATFINQWVKTGRLAKLEQEVWQKDPYLRMLAEIPRKLKQLEIELPTLKLHGFIPRVAQVLSASIKAVPHDDNLFVQRIQKILNCYLSAAVARGDYNSARSCLPLLLQQLKDNSNASGLNGIKVIRDLEAAQNSVSLSVDRYERAHTLKQLAISRYAQGDKTGAEQTFLRALQQAPHDGDILVSLGRICYESRRYEDAMKYNQAALGINAQNTEAWIGLAFIARDLKSQDAMRTACEQVRNLNPHHPKYQELVRELH
jgi:GT2 family glycosyltransferase